MSENNVTITVTVHEADEVPGSLTYAYMKTEDGWEIVRWLLLIPLQREDIDVYGWETSETGWRIMQPGLWVELKDIAEAVEEETAAYTDPPGERRHLRFMTAESGEYNVVERGREHLVQFVRELRDGPYVDWTISLIAFTGEYCDQ